MHGPVICLVDARRVPFRRVSYKKVLSTCRNPSVQEHSVGTRPLTGENRSRIVSGMYKYCGRVALAGRPPESDIAQDTGNRPSCAISLVMQFSYERTRARG